MAAPSPSPPLFLRPRRGPARSVRRATFSAHRWIHAVPLGELEKERRWPPPTLRSKKTGAKRGNRLSLAGVEVGPPAWWFRATADGRQRRGAIAAPTDWFDEPTPTWLRYDRSTRSPPCRERVPAPLAVPTLAQLGAMIFRMTQFLVPLGRSYVNPAFSKRLRVPLYKNDEEVFRPCVSWG